MVLNENEVRSRETLGGEFSRTIAEVIHALQVGRDIPHDLAALSVHLALDKMLEGDLTDFFRITSNPASSAVHVMVTFLSDKFRDVLASAADEQIRTLGHRVSTIDGLD